MNAIVMFVFGAVLHYAYVEWSKKHRERVFYKKQLAMIAEMDRKIAAVGELKARVQHSGYYQSAIDDQQLLRDIYRQSLPGKPQKPQLKRVK